MADGSARTDSAVVISSPTVGKPLAAGSAQSRTPPATSSHALRVRQPEQVPRRVAVARIVAAASGVSPSNSTEAHDTTSSTPWRSAGENGCAHPSSPPPEDSRPWQGEIAGGEDRGLTVRRPAVVIIPSDHRDRRDAGSGCSDRLCVRQRRAAVGPGEGASVGSGPDGFVAVVVVKSQSRRRSSEPRW